MKKIAPLAMIAFLLFSLQNVFAQSDNKKEEAYRIKIVKNENGQEKVIDRTFATREEMVEFMRENKLNLPEPAELAELPPLPPDAPSPPDAPNPPTGRTCNKTKKEYRKVIIIENEEMKNKK